MRKRGCDNKHTIRKDILEEKVITEISNRQTTQIDKLNRKYIYDLINMIYLNKDHDIKDKYEDSDWIKIPLVIFLNNTYDLLIKKEVMKEYGFEEIEKEVKKMCNLGEMIARENIEKGHSMGLEQGQKLERRKKNIELITNLMNSLSISFSKAVELLKVSEDEVLEIKKY